MWMIAAVLLLLLSLGNVASFSIGCNDCSWTVEVRELNRPAPYVQHINKSLTAESVNDLLFETLDWDENVQLWDQVKP